MSAIGGFFKNVIGSTGIGQLLGIGQEQEAPPQDPANIEIDMAAVDKMVMGIWNSSHSSGGGGAIGT